MSKLLSICIPTYNRAIEIDRQLAWLAQEIKGFESECEVIVSDNCSEDETPAVIAKWQPAFAQIAFKTNRNIENIGWMRNFARCYQLAAGTYTWIIGDDDLIYDGTLKKVLKTLQSRSISLMYLDFLGRNRETGEIVGDRWFGFDFEPQDFSNGKAVFQRCIAKNIGSVIFITATICRTDLAWTALQKWPESVNNWGGVAFWYGYCALHGDVVVTEEIWVECTMGASYWQKDPRAWFRIRHADIPEVFAKLQGIGYPLGFCRDRIVGVLREDFLSDQTLHHLKDYLRSLKHKPIWAIGIMASFFATVAASFVGFEPIEANTAGEAVRSSARELSSLYKS